MMRFPLTVSAAASGRATRAPSSEPRVGSIEMAMRRGSILCMQAPAVAHAGAKLNNRSRCMCVK